MMKPMDDRNIFDRYRLQLPFRKVSLPEMQFITCMHDIRTSDFSTHPPPLKPLH